MHGIARWMEDAGAGDHEQHLGSQQVIVGIADDNILRTRAFCQAALWWAGNPSVLKEGLATND
jgi:hypothetical protein